MKNICLNCGAGLEQNLCCSKCKKAFYCNSECQRQHWKVHKHECNSINNAQINDDQDTSEPVLSYTIANDKGNLDYYLIVTIDDDKPKSTESFMNLARKFMESMVEKDYRLNPECLCMLVKMDSEKDKAQKFGIHTPIILSISTFTQLIRESTSSSFNEFIATAAKVFYEPFLHRIHRKVRDKTLEILEMPPDTAGQLIHSLQMHNLRVTSKTHDALKKYWNKESSSDYIHALWGSWNYEERRKFMRSVRYQTPESETEPYYISKSGEKEDVSGMLLFCPELNLKYLVRYFPSFLDQSVSK